ncbi:hypothetical protein GCM10010429_24530 [Micromonospora olivasterospora]
MIKVEDAAGDPMRNARSRRVAQGLTAPSFAAYNAHKRSVVLNLKDPEGHAAALRLCDGADAVLSSFRPGVLERLGLGADVLRSRNPRLVVARLSAFGESGPDRDRGGVDIVLQAESGLMAITGEADGPPMKAGAPIVDAASGFVLALGVVSALLGRERGGELRELTVSMLDVAVALQGPAAGGVPGLPAGAGTRRQPRTVRRHIDEVAELLSRSSRGGTPASWRPALTGRHWGVHAVDEEFLAEQQYAADLFHRFGVIPRAVTVVAAVAAR